jgi:hypothetical protein
VEALAEMVHLKGAFALSRAGEDIAKPVANGG